MLQALAAVFILTTFPPKVGADTPAPASRPSGRIAFIRDDSLWICQGDGSEVRKLVYADKRLRQCYHYPAWMPDGRHITFLRSYGAQPLPTNELLDIVRVWVVDSENRTVRPLFQNAGSFSLESWRQYVCWGRTSWGPAGQRAAVVWPGFYHDNGLVDCFEDHLQIRIFDRRRKQWRELKGGGYTPAWSPSGRQLAYAVWPHYDLTVAQQERSADPGHPFGLWIASRPSLKPRQITRSAGDSNPFFLQDGKTLYFLRWNKTWCVEGQGKRRRNLGHLRELKIHSQWVGPPGNRRGRGRLLGVYPPEVTWSPDRRHVAFVTPKDLRDNDATVGTLYVSDIHGKWVRRVCDGAESPAWSPK
ncbi:MAG: PD40 domain-containing protein [Armatimonadetes bacterium]|nr:PD40 domain-containing protein [Armatimonadota bacterium]